MSIQDYQKTPAQVVTELSDILRKHNYFYYVLDAPTIEDVVYDSLFKTLKDLEALHPELVKPDSPTQTVGHPVYGSHFKLVKRKIPMLSLDNVFTPEEAVDWTIDVHQDTMALVNYEPLEIVPEWKMDGLSLNVHYSNQVYSVASTRGDGTTGEDVTPNALMLEGLPVRLKVPHPKFAEVHVRGEVVVRLADYHAVNEFLVKAGKKVFANPRNYASGSLRQKDPRITRGRKLVFVAYSIESDERTDPTDGDWYADQQWLKDNGFITADTGLRFDHSIPNVTTKIPKILDECLALRSSYPFEVDGVVLKVVKYSHRDSLGFNSRFPRWARAYKFPASKGITKLLAVERQVGRTGKLTPVARIQPVLVHGTMISNVTIHNLNELEKHQLWEGCEVLISRAGDVIPYLESRVTELGKQFTEIDVKPLYGVITKCPCCGSDVDVIEGKKGSKAEYCSNLDCPGRLLAHLVYCASRDVLNIKGLGDELVLDLQSKGVVDAKRPLSLLWLRKDDFLKIGLSEHMADKLETAVSVAIAELDLTRVITALGISGVADGTSERLARELQSLEVIANASVEQLAGIRDIGTVTAQCIFEFFDADNRLPKEASVWRPFIEGLTLPTPAPLGTLFPAGTTFVVTGSKFGERTRKELESFLKKNGAKVSSTVNKSTSGVYCGTKYTAHKLETAKTLGINWVIYSEDGLHSTSGESFEIPAELR